MVTALHHGAEAIIPVAEIPEALAVRQNQPGVLLAGERNGLRIPAELTGSIPFDLGNSPREFTPEAVHGRTIVMSTTNGTRALDACVGARQVLVGSLLNLRATARFLDELRPPNLLVVCSGTLEEAAYEDILGAGALCDLLWPCYGAGAVADSAYAARRLFGIEQNDLASAFSQTRNGRRLLSLPELRDDVAFCLQRDSIELVAGLMAGHVRRLL